MSEQIRLHSLIEKSLRDFYESNIKGKSTNPIVLKDDPRFFVAVSFYSIMASLDGVPIQIQVMDKQTKYRFSMTFPSDDFKYEDIFNTIADRVCCDVLAEEDHQFEELRNWLIDCLSKGNCNCSNEIEKRFILYSKFRIDDLILELRIEDKINNLILRLQYTIDFLRCGRFNVSNVADDIIKLLKEKISRNENS